MSSHRESGDDEHAHDEAEETVVAQAGEGELADVDLEQASGGFSFGVTQTGTMRLAEAGDGKLLGNVLT